MKKESISEKIARRAFEIYEVRGGNNGQDLDDWFQAEQEVLAETNPKKRKSSLKRPMKKR
jgi:hypothetical protein